MKYLAILIIILTGITLPVIFYYENKHCTQQEGLENMKAIISENSLLTCSLTNSELVERKTKLLPQIYPFIEEIKELEDGYLFQFPNDNDLLSKLLEVINLESRCCSFLEFNLKIEANKGPVWLQFTGPKGAKEFIKENFMSN